MFSTICCTAAGLLASGDSSRILDHSRSLTVQWSSSVVCPNFAYKMIVFVYGFLRPCQQLVTYTYAIEWQSLLTCREELQSALIELCITPRYLHG